MIYPTPADILRCVEHTIQMASADDMPRMAVKSALATSGHLIRHVELRMKMERSILLDDVEKAAALLDNLAAYLSGGSAGRTKLARDIRGSLAKAPQLLSAEPDDTEAIRERAKDLRELIYSALKELQSATAAEKTAKPYLDARRLLRGYMTYQIQQEARLVTPAFFGHGPRR